MTLNVSLPLFCYPWLAALPTNVFPLSVFISIPLPEPQPSPSTATPRRRPPLCAPQVSQSVVLSWNQKGLQHRFLASGVLLGWICAMTSGPGTDPQPSPSPPPDTEAITIVFETVYFSCREGGVRGWGVSVDAGGWAGSAAWRRRQLHQPQQQGSCLARPAGSRCSGRWRDAAGKPIPSGTRARSRSSLQGARTSARCGCARFGTGPRPPPPPDRTQINPAPPLPLPPPRPRASRLGPAPALSLSHPAPGP